MDETTRLQLDALNNALLTLSATGAKGFEGLIAKTLTEIAGVPFRLAGSGGPQFGIDGKAAYAGDGVSFECKLYEGTIPKEKVLSKLTEVSLDDSIELWALCATVPVPTQIADPVVKFCERQGVALLILDWAQVGLPALAAALAMASSTVADFLRDNLDDSNVVSAAIAALEAIRGHSGFKAHADRIRTALIDPAAGITFARKANAHWLTETFSDKGQARVRFGQPVAPGDTQGGGAEDRPRIRSNISPYLTGEKSGVLCVHGGEGCGKSWAVAQTWLSLDSKPLLLFLTPEDFQGQSKWSLEELLIAKLIEQTGSPASDASAARWRRSLARWRDHRSETSPLVVVIDGINQRPSMDWARIMDPLEDLLGKMGGRLIVTSRTAYYRNDLQRRLTTTVREIDVPEWTDAERDVILSTHGITAGELRPAVAESLRNPRLLGIALELFHKADIRRLEEISVSRLLFEHLRIGERDAPSPKHAHEFARRLRDDAREILSRLTAQQSDDLKVFNASLDAAADGRFYEPVAGDPSRIILREDSLPLALAFDLLDRLRFAERNGHDLSAMLDAVIEPIAALDLTAETLLAAISVACLDNTQSDAVAAALISAFCELQNLPVLEFGAFAALARKRPAAFMIAAEGMCLSGSRQPNFDWLQGALLEAAKDASAWFNMGAFIRSWLGYYSRSPDHALLSNPTRDPKKKVEEERERNRKRIEEELNSLSPPEQDILDQLVEAEGDLSSLARMALTLIAGRPVAPFAQSLVRWGFASALNSNHWAPYKEFGHLISLNRVDWPDAREALLRECAPLRARMVSDTGKWALASILRATGQPEDGAEWRSLVEYLTRDRPRFGSWRLVERYCATDPCDPSAIKPGNVVATARNYAAIDVASLRLTMGNSSEDHFFVMGRPGVARFEEATAMAKHREFAANVLGRQGLPLRQGLIELRSHAALLTETDAHELLVQHRTAIANPDGALSERDEWFVAQYQLLLAFPLLTAQEQVEVLISEPSDEPILLELMHLTKRLSASTFERMLGEAIKTGNERHQYVLLAFARFGDTPLSGVTRDYLASLLGSESAQIRTEVLGLIAQLGDRSLLKAVAASGWDSAQAARPEDFEVWYGSEVLLQAAAQELLVPEQVLNRISPRLYGRAATILKGETARDIARRIDEAIHRVVGIGNLPPAPDVEFHVRDKEPNEPPRYSVSEQEAGDFSEAMRRWSESSEEFEKRQSRLQQAFVAFRSELTHVGACLILDNLELGQFEAILRANERLIGKWHGLFMGLPRAKLPLVHNLVLLLAHALSGRDPEKAIELFRLTAESRPIVRFTFGPARIALDTVAAWSGLDNDALNQIRYERLDRAENDHELFQEVLGALRAGKQQVLEAYANEKLASEQPSEIARGIMIAGFSDQSAFAEAALARYCGAEGLPGAAQKAAQYAYERNAWARHWFDIMRTTEDVGEFWGASILFGKVVDPRYALWSAWNETIGTPMTLFRSSIECRLPGRFEKWENRRRKKLFGEDAPSPLFLGR